MGTRSFISMTAINRMVSSHNANKREQERLDLIKRLSGNEKELPPTYQLLKIDFNSETRSTKIEILQSQQYRTVDRYVTQNYVRYPIYSYWKTRTKTIKKSIKLTNNELEKLNVNPDSLIRDLSKEIILALNNEELLPSWFLIEIYFQLYNENIEDLNEAFESFRKVSNINIQNFKDSIDNINKDLSATQRLKTKEEKKKEKLIGKILKIEKATKHPAKYIFTLFIYAYSISNTRKQRLINRVEKLDKRIQLYNDNIEKQTQQINDFKNSISSIEEQVSKKYAELQSNLSSALNDFERKKNSTSPLPTEVSIDSEFIPLKMTVGIEYQKIIGCYIIHNKENNKYYVGQSKDVLKRLKQHFKGTVPNNIIFAEDYYSSKINKSELFEVKIIPCETKDELDQTEKALIEQYDAFVTGYNGTNGNT